MKSETPIDRVATVTSVVVEAWQRALNLGQAPKGDVNFVSLGGDSLMLMAILADVEESFGVDIDVEAVLADLTMAGMTRAVLAAIATSPGGDDAL